MSPADLADLRRQNPKPQNITTQTNCLSLRNNAACCIPLRDLRICGRIQQAYLDVRWRKAMLTVGSKEQPMEQKNQELSSGSQCLGINSRPVPQVRLSLPDFMEYTQELKDC
jgi:hypothetical protein